VLKVISRSTFDLQTVLDTLTESAARLCEADIAGIVQLKGSVYRAVASYGYAPQEWEFVKTREFKAERGSISGRALVEGRVVHVPDVLEDPEFANLDIQKIVGFRTMLGVPLMREGSPVGVMVIQRRHMRPFTDKQIELVTTFADQAVIAIENVRLFEEVQVRTNELAQSVKELRALGEVTQSVNSSVDLETVLSDPALQYRSWCDLCF
jgi:two-component system, NtrC family, sensor kinase